MTTISSNDDELDLTAELLQDTESLREVQQGEDALARGEGIGKADLDRLMSARAERRGAADAIAAHEVQRVPYRHEHACL